MSAATDARQPAPEGRTTPDMIAHRFGQVTAWGAIALGIVVAIATLINALAWRAQPFPGLTITQSLVVDATVPFDPTTWTGRVAGIRPTDRLLELDGVAFSADPLDYAAASADYQRRIAALQAGDSVIMTFERSVPAGAARASQFGVEQCGVPENGFAICRARFSLGTFSDADFLSLFIIPYITGLVAFGIGAGLVVLRGRELAPRLAGAATLCFAGFCLSYFDLISSHQFIRLWLITAIMLGVALLLVALVFPVPFLFIRRQPLIRTAIVFVGFGLSAVAIAIHETNPDPRLNAMGIWLAGAFAITGNLAVAFIMLRRRRQAGTVVVRDQVNTMLLGSGLGSIIGLVWLVNVIIRLLTEYDPLSFNTQPTMPIQLIPLVAMAYAVLRGRLRESDRALSQSITYALLLVTLVVGYALLVLAVSLIVGSNVSPGNPILIAIAVFFLAVLFAPVRTRLQNRIDKLYFRQRVDYTEALEAFSRDLVRISEVEQIVPALRNQIDGTLTPSQAYLFLPGESGDYHAADTDILFAASSPLITLLRRQPGIITLTPGLTWDRAVVAERARLHVLNGQVIAGMYDSGGALTAFVVLAPPRGGESVYNYEALRYLENLMVSVGVAFERARAVDTLERRVAELNAFSQISQGVNFTLDLDDQLELLYAQTTRLIDASHFYLTLHDRALGELYHAFFVENDERLIENENRRWRTGSDFFSEIIRTGQPISVAHYGEAAAALRTSAVIEDKGMHAWIGVPLAAGDTVIGVLSIGTSNPERRFGPDTVKVLRDIAQLAATSLDKARLFNETNERARQFAALNAVAGEIVAAEKDVDRLLDLIINSVTDLLNAEAGSLLLMTDDDTGDLEFKVVSGGGGKGLIGVRVPSGRGLVGEVASTARPVLVNDASNDPRWGGEFAKGAFRTNSVLAVPLLTQNRVIGVLEVLNKMRGGGFSADDVQLLTAFGAQAAVAIENARLFQMTDFQLSQRVSELETMERIDVELNRSLDLRRIAEITVQSAVQTTGGTAGLLGLIAGEPPALTIIMKQGYGDADIPDGAEGDRYPMDRGIIARVLRSRQSELVYDVRLDQGYAPILRGAVSQAALPMISAGSVIGVLLIESAGEARLRLADMPFLQRLIEHAAIAIVNAQLYAEVERANESKSEFVSFVAHELKNPLTVVKGYGENLLRLMQEDMPRSALRLILDNADRMNTIVSDLNDVTKLETKNLRLTLRPVSVRYVIDETIRPFEARLREKGQTVVVEIADDVPPMLADEGRLIQVMTNLVSNAYKYSPEDTTITVGAYLDHMVADARGKLIGTQVHLYVRDQGIGMSEDDVKRLFTPYFRSDNELARAQPGTGLGLTITRGIIDGHGGTIRVESELGVGTTFHITIPPVTETAAAPGD